MGTAQNWTVTPWGTRGAVPRAEGAFLTYGGNTSCFSVRCGDAWIVFDAGSGMIRLGNALARRGGPKQIHIFLSHLHLDHIQGLAGFQPLEDPGADIHLYGESRDGEDVLTQLNHVFRPPFWPKGLGSGAARLTVHAVGPGMRVSPAEGLSVRTLRGVHPNQSLLYRLDGMGRSVVYTLDCECTEGITPALTEFAQNCGLLIWDANFIEADWEKGRGHSTWEQGLALAQAAGAERVLMAHYDRSRTDAFLEEQERLAREKSALCLFAREGMEIVV